MRTHVRSSLRDTVPGALSSATNKWNWITSCKFSRKQYVIDSSLLQIPWKINLKTHFYSFLKRFVFFYSFFHWKFRNIHIILNRTLSFCTVKQIRFFVFYKFIQLTKRNSRLWMKNFLRTANEHPQDVLTISINSAPLTNFSLFLSVNKN